jgi:transcriptional repressor NrdR
MRCPRCGVDDDKVVDSRAADDASAIRRRRQCLACGFRFTTYERFEEAPIVVVKRSGGREPFDRSKIVDGVRQAAKYRPITDVQIDSLASDIDEELRLSGAGEVTTQEIGVAVLDRLRALDPIVYLRFASVYKGFEDPSDFEREAAALSETGGLTKFSHPKASTNADDAPVD